MTFAHWLAWLLGISAALYVGISIAYAAGSRPGMTVAFIGYAIANIGIVWDAFHSAPK